MESFFREWWFRRIFCQFCCLLRVMWSTLNRWKYFLFCSFVNVWSVEYRLVLRIGTLLLGNKKESLEQCSSLIFLVSLFSSVFKSSFLTLVTTTEEYRWSSFGLLNSSSLERFPLDFSSGITLLESFTRDTLTCVAYGRDPPTVSSLCFVLKERRFRASKSVKRQSTAQSSIFTVERHTKFFNPAFFLLQKKEHAKLSMNPNF